MERPSPDQTQDPLEVDVNLLMQQQLPRYVVNCLQAAGYDELEVIASMDTNEGEASSISKIEKYIEKYHKSNPDMLPSYSTESSTSLPFEFPPGHRIRICNFVHEIKQLYRNTRSSNVSTKLSRSATEKRLKLIPQPEDKLPLSVDEITCQVHESINKWIKHQKHSALNSLKEGKHYTVIVNKHGNGQIVAVINCGICHTSVRLHLLNRHYQISNWTRHMKRCASGATIDSKQTKLLLPKISSSAAKLSDPTTSTQSVSANDAAVVSEPPQSPSNVLTIDSSESANLENPQVFCLAPPLLQKGGPN